MDSKIKGEWKDGNFYADLSSIPLSYWKELDRQAKQSIDNWLVEQFVASTKNIQFFIQVTCFVSFVAMAILSL